MFVLLRGFLTLVGWILLCLHQVHLVSPQAIHLSSLQNMHPTDYEIVIPYRVDHLGNHVSHDLLLPRREKRSLPSNKMHQSAHLHGSQSEEASHQMDQSEDVFHYHIDTSEGSRLRLLLRPHRELISDRFRVHLRRNSLQNGRTVRTTESWTLDDMCVFVGTVVGQESSSVALSVCQGMTGMIHTNNGSFLIEPLQHKREVNSSAHPSHRPHVMYRHSHLPRYNRSTAGDGTDFCHNSGTEDSILETAFKYRDQLSPPPRSRHRRSAGIHREYPGVRDHRPRTMDTLVVVDNAMLAQHGHENITTYVLTILNVVSNLFHDNTIGTKINISLAALILLEGEEAGFEVGHHADKSLSNFCQWQSELQGLEHDHAILLTGEDICSYSDTPCDTLGYAPIKGMCKPQKSCTINEDTGLGTAFTIAHEAGHNLGMFHDGQNNYCKDHKGCIMAPTLLGQDGMFKWSACSRKYLNKFLRSRQADCLSDQPHQVSALHFPSKQPGEMYPSDIQCKWQFGAHARLCVYDFARDLCNSLWCYTGGVRCQTKFLPAAEGTSCGMAKWCRKGVCVAYGDEGPAPISGGWSTYSDWSGCSRTCGGGVMYKERVCNSPRPQYGGRDCGGEARIYKMCNRQVCPEDAVSFRSQQCSVYDNRMFRGSLYKWKPYTSHHYEEDKCQLYCKADNFHFYFSFSPKVIDGTPCGDQDLVGGVCVEGTCYHAGCDQVVDSGARLDMCGVCNGDNSTCRLIEGTFRDYVLPNSYHSILSLPVGARSIRIEEAEISPSYLALRDVMGKYYLTGGWRVALPGDYPIAGTVFSYRRAYNKPELLTAVGPTKEELVVEVLVQGKSPSIHYEFTVPRVVTDPNAVTPPAHNYTWSASTSQCSRTCAGGEKVTSARCLEDHHDEVPDYHCDSGRKPSTGTVACNSQPCPARWVPSPWKSCSQTCGGGVQKRRVACMRKTSHDQHDVRQRKRHCASVPRPARRQRCNTQECPPEWHVGNWTQCSTSCGDGVRTREVYCRTLYNNRYFGLPPGLCVDNAKPNSSETCLQQDCYRQIQWFLSSWTDCSKTCDTGRQSRQLRCSGRDGKDRYRPLEDSYCDHLSKPSVTFTRDCQVAACPRPHPRWFVSPWADCSATCGTGIQKRVVKCMDEVTGKLSDGCKASTQPDTTITCQQGHCKSKGQKKASQCQDAFKWCSLVSVHQLCVHPFYGPQCCKTCGNSSGGGGGSHQGL